MARQRVEPARFVMVGNSLKSDVLPVLEAGGAAVYIPYHVTWAHEAEAEVADDEPRLRRVAQASELPAAVTDIARAAAADIDIGIAHAAIKRNNALSG